MTLKEMFAKVKTNPAFVGFITTDQMVLAIDVSAEQNADVDEFAVAYMGFTDRSSSLNPKAKAPQRRAIRELSHSSATVTRATPSRTLLLHLI